MKDFISNLSNKITALSKNFKIFFFVWVGIAIVVSFCSMINLCVNTSPATAVESIFSAILAFALFGALIYALVAKKDKMFILLFSFYLIYYLAAFYFNAFSYISTFGYNNNATAMTDYAFKFLAYLAAGCITVCVVLNELKANKIYIKIIDIAAIVYLVFMLIILILDCFVYSWTQPIYDIERIAFMILLVISIHTQQTPVEEIKSIEDKTANEEDLNNNDTTNTIQY